MTIEDTSDDDATEANPAVMSTGPTMVEVTGGELKSTPLLLTLK